MIGLVADLAVLVEVEDAVGRAGDKDREQPVAVEVDVVGKDAGRVESRRVSYGVVYASFVPTGGTFRTRAGAVRCAVAPG